MADWTTLPNTAVGVGGLPSATTITALRDNPVAIAEGAPGAPKIEPNARRQLTVVSGASAQTQIFTGLDDYSGIEFSMAGTLSGSTLRTYLFSYSTDGGSTWSTGQSLLGNFSPDRIFNVQGSFDFNSGRLAGNGLLINFGTSSPASLRFSTNLAGASLAINAVKFEGSGTGLNSWGFIIPNGGLL